MSRKLMSIDLVLLALGTALLIYGGLLNLVSVIFGGLGFYAIVFVSLVLERRKTGK